MPVISGRDGHFAGDELLPDLTCVLVEASYVVFRVRVKQDYNNQLGGAYLVVKVL